MKLRRDRSRRAPESTGGAPRTSVPTARSSGDVGAVGAPACAWRTPAACRTSPGTRHRPEVDIDSRTPPSGTRTTSPTGTLWACGRRRCGSLDPGLLGLGPAQLVGSSGDDVRGVVGGREEEFPSFGDPVAGSAARSRCSAVVPVRGAPITKRGSTMRSAASVGSTVAPCRWRSHRRRGAEGIGR